VLVGGWDASLIPEYVPGFSHACPSIIAADIANNPPKQPANIIMIILETI
jgi:hypothetical protein